MTDQRAALEGLLEFLHGAERMKVLTRSAHTSDGAPETVAAHSWRVALLALAVSRWMPEIDVGRLLAICLVHDLGEAIGGDVPAPEQARRAAASTAGDAARSKSADERRDLVSLVGPLPPEMREHIVSLWDEYDAAASPEARLAKALDKLETILQHTEGRNPPGFDYRFNLGYGRAHTASPPLVATLRALLDDATAARARGAE